MTPSSLRAAALLSALSLAACSGLKDALSAHVDIAARAGSQELSVTRLAQLLASAQVPPRKDIGLALANLWVNYQLLAHAVVRGDSFSDPKVIDDAMWAQLAQLRSKKFYEGMLKSFAAPDSSTVERKYYAGDLLAARHILFGADANVMQPSQRDSVRRVAERVAKQLTAENFAQMAQRYSADPGSKSAGGDLGVFRKGQMVAEFERGVLALKPGDVSGVIESRFGFHIIKRQTWPEARVKFSAAYDSVARQSAESTYLDQMEKNANVEIRPGASKNVKAVAEDLDGHRDDNTVLVTSRGGNLTAARLAKWVAAFPSQERLREQIAQAQDSMIPTFLRNLMRNELILRAADSAKIAPDTAELNGLRRAFTGSFQNTVSGLRLGPGQLGDSAKSRKDRERVAAGRVDAYMADLLQNKVPFIDVSEPVAHALRRKYESRVVAAGIERAVAEAGRLKAQADSARTQAMPSSVVPMPGADTGKAAAKKP